jgi:cell division GTPase FtsZ
MNMEKEAFLALVEARLAAPGGPDAEADEAECAARMLGELVRRDGLMIEVAPEDVIGLLADWRRPAMDVRVFEATEPRAVGVDGSLDEWLRGAEAVVIEVAGGPDLTLHEVSSLAERLYDWFRPDIDVVFGASVAEHLRGLVGLRLVALGAPA